MQIAISNQRHQRMIHPDKPSH